MQKQTTKKKIKNKKMEAFLNTKKAATTKMNKESQSHDKMHAHTKIEHKMQKN